MNNKLKLVKNELKTTPGGSQIDSGGSQIDPVASGGSQVVPESVPVTFWGALGDPFGTQNGAQKPQDLLKIEPISKKTRKFQQNNKKSEICEKCNTSYEITMILEVPRDQK